MVKRKAKAKKSISRKAKAKPKRNTKHTERKTKTPKYSSKEKVFGLIELGRPLEWSKTLLNMFLAAMMAFYVFGIRPLDLGIFVIGFISVAFLWSALYALNDYTDRFIDAQHRVKKNRPIPSGKVSPACALKFVGLLLIISFGIAYYLNNFLLGMCLLIMVANQLLYTMEPYRLKSRKYIDFVSGSMINPIFRYFSGMVLFVPAGILFFNQTPILPLLFVICMQFGGYSLYRLFSKKDDKKFKMESSVAKISENKVKMVSYFAIGVAILSYILMLVNGSTYRSLSLGYLPQQFAWALVLPLLFIPLLKDAILNPGKASMKTSYRAIYVMNIAFISANILIFILAP